jgi:signal transduction histidine kinase
MALRRAINNLTDNAARYGDHVWLRLSRDGDTVKIVVEDDGPGIPEEEFTRVLEPFVRLDDARQRDAVGFGLGLAIVARTVEAQGGTLTLSTRRGGGLCATIALPAASVPM